MGPLPSERGEFLGSGLPLRLMQRALRCGVVLLVLLAVAACGRGAGAGTSPGATPSGSPTSIPTIGTTPTPTPAPAPTPTATAGTSGCQPSQLSLSTGARNAGTGSVQEVFIFTNIGAAPCQLFGYPGMQMLGSGGQQIPTKVVRMQSTEATVTLAPGATASFLAQWHDQTGYMTPCATSQSVQVTPPNDTTQLTVAAAIQACPDGTINVNAVVAGSAGGQ